MNSAHFEFRILPDENLMLVMFFGAVTLGDLNRLLNTCMKDPEYNPGHDVIFDYRQSTAMGYRFEVPEFVQSIRKAVKVAHTKRYGLLYNTPNQKFIFTLFRASGPLMNIKIEMFRELEDCLKWLKGDLGLLLRINLTYDEMRNHYRKEH